MHSATGSTRPLVVAALVAAAVLLAATVLVIVGGDAPTPARSDATDARDAVEEVLGAGGPGRARRTEDPDDADDDPYAEDDDGIVEFEGGDREAWGEEFRVTPDSLLAVFAARHWEELRRQIDVLQREGGTVPQEVVDGLLALLDGSDTRLDAVLALGQITSDAAGRALAQRALGAAYPLDVRTAALDALAHSGNRAAFDELRTLVGDAATDPALLRHAYPALAAMGTEESARLLVDALRANAGGDLESSIVSALGKAAGAGDVLAQSLRAARDAGDRDLAARIVTIAHLGSALVSDDLRGEVRRLIEDRTAVEFAGDADAQLGLRAGAIAAAAAIGGDLLDPVLRIAETNPDNLRAVALHGLRQARGDDAAAAILRLVEPAAKGGYEREVLEALGETRSWKATRTLVERLDADDVNVRHAAARGLVTVRDPDSVKPILARLERSLSDYVMARSLLDALGTIGANEALPRLEQLVDDKAVADASLKVFVQRAIQRIRTGDPETNVLAR